MIKANAKRNSKSERTYPCLILVAMSKLSLGCSLCKTRPVKVFLMMFKNVSEMPQCFSLYLTTPLDDLAFTDDIAVHIRQPSIDAEKIAEVDRYLASTRQNEVKGYCQ